MWKIEVTSYASTLESAIKLFEGEAARLKQAGYERGGQGGGGGGGGGFGSSVTGPTPEPLSDSEVEQLRKLLKSRLISEEHTLAAGSRNKASDLRNAVFVPVPHHRIAELVGLG